MIFLIIHCHRLPFGGQVVQTGSDVMPVVVHLLTVEAALCLQTAESLTELLQLRPPTLTVQTLLTDVLREGNIAALSKIILKQ